jgi:hypothetical protein
MGEGEVQACLPQCLSHQERVQLERGLAEVPMTPRPLRGDHEPAVCERYGVGKEHVRNGPLVNERTIDGLE